MDLHTEIIGNEWKESIVLASVPLWKYNEDNIPIANASACLVEYKKVKFLLSIAHSTIAESCWHVEVCSVNEMDGDLGTIIQEIEMDSLTGLNLEQDNIKDYFVDFTYKRLPDNFKSEHVIAIHNNKSISAMRTVFNLNLDFQPKIGKKCGFYGNVKFSGVQDRFLKFEHRLETDLKYLGKIDNNLVFQLPHKYGSHSNYQGCSGAPIIDEDNNLLGLVSFGEKSTNTIHAIDIARYRAILDINSEPKIF